MAKVLIMHGWTNLRVEGNWHRYLATELRKLGHVVIYPQFPSTNSPLLEDWQDLLIAELQQLEEAGPGETIAIGHSLGCINWVHAAAAGKINHPIDRLLLVAPADPDLLTEIKGLNADLRDQKVRAALHASAKSITIVGSDSDPWSPRGVQATFGDPLGVQAVILEGAKHLALSDGFTYWQGVIDWVLDSQADLTVR